MPNAREKGVFPVDVRTEVRKVHNMAGNSSAQAPFKFSNLDFKWNLMISLTVSSCPLGEQEMRRSLLFPN